MATSRQSRKVLDHPPSRTPRAKGWNNSELKVEQLVERITCHSYHLQDGAGFHKPEGWWRVGSRFWLRSFWWAESKLRKWPTQHNSSGQLAEGAHQRSSCQDTWRNQRDTVTAAEYPNTAGDQQCHMQRHLQRRQEEPGRAGELQLARKPTRRWCVTGAFVIF